MLSHLPLGVAALLVIPLGHGLGDLFAGGAVVLPICAGLLVLLNGCRAYPCRIPKRGAFVVGSALCVGVDGGVPSF
jgi:hypothetical protein